MEQMSREEMELIAELVAARVTKDVLTELKERNKAHYEQVDRHERILKGSNGDTGLVGMVRMLDRRQKMIYGILSLAGVSFFLEILSRLWELIQSGPALPVP